MQHDTLWNEAVAFTRAKSPASFEQWFSGVQFDGMTDGIVSLRARDEFVREWVDQHFLPTLVDFLRSQTGWSVQVAWCVGGDLERPVALGHGQPALPVRPRAMMPDRPIPQQRPNEGGDFERSSSPPPSQRSPGYGSYASQSGGNGTNGGTNGYGKRKLEIPSELGYGASGHASGHGKAGSVTDRPIEGLNPKYTFGNFVVGPSNQLAHAAAIAASGGGGPRHNPLFLCGGTGLGKTHLVHAVAHRFRSERPSSRILYVSAEKFVNEFVQALQEGRMNEFRARYRERCDLLLVDDIQFLASKTQTQEEFFHAFNALHQADKQIIVTSDKYPQQLEKMEERLVSRFSWGLVADIQGPELETRVAILRKKAQLEEIELADEVVLFLAQTIRSNVRELEGTLIRLAAKSSLLGKHVEPARERGRRRRHPARRVSPLQAAHERSALQGSPQEHRVRATRGDVPLQAAPQVQLPRAGARVRQPRSHDRDERRPQGGGAARQRSRGACPPRSARAQAGHQRGLTGAGARAAQRAASSISAAATPLVSAPSMRGLLSQSPHTSSLRAGSNRHGAEVLFRARA